MKINKLDTFLKESNLIEGVFDLDSFLQAKYAWEYLIEQPEMTLGVVLKTHKILMLHQNLQPDERGYFRKCEVTIGGRFGLNWFKVPDAMRHWVGAMNEKMKIEDDAMMLHVEYEKIHPFVDGNGRTGRLFLNWGRVKKLKKDILVIKDSEKAQYYKLFRQDPDWSFL